MQFLKKIKEKLYELREEGHQLDNKLKNLIIVLLVIILIIFYTPLIIGILSIIFVEWLLFL